MTDLARRIVEDIEGLHPFVPREDEISGLAHAYAVQREVNARLIESRLGRHVAGYKIAFNRPSSMDYYRLREPCHAPIFSDQLHISGVELSLASFADLVIEPEIALRVVAPVSVTQGFDELALAVEALPSIEIMDVRGAFAHDPSAAAAIAQRIHGEGAVVGAAVPFLASAVHEASLSVDGRIDGSARDAAPQPPLAALHWLIGALARTGESLQPGMVVLTGAHLPGRPIRAPGTIKVEIAPYGDVTLQMRP